MSKKLSKATIMNDRDSVKRVRDRAIELRYCHPTLLRELVTALSRAHEILDAEVVAKLTADSEKTR